MARVSCHMGVCDYKKNYIMSLIHCVVLIQLLVISRPQCIIMIHGEDNIMYMFKYILKRIGLMLMTFLIITVMCFVLIKLLPSLPAEQYGQDASIILQRREALGYNKPIMVQFGILVKYVVTEGYWGHSEQLYFGREVAEVFLEKVPYTIAVNLYSMVLSVPIGLVLGIVAALKKNKWEDHVISTGVMIFVSVPSFIYAFLVQYLMYFEWGLSSAIMDPSQGPWSWLGFSTMIPAILSLSFGSIAGFARYTRAELTEVLTSEFMLLARTKGLTRGQATIRHAMRNSMVPIFPMIIGTFVSVLSGSLIIENMFSIPGVGALYIGAIQTTPPDYNFFMLLTCFYTLIGLAVGIVIDISYGIIDPRIRMGAR